MKLLSYFIRLARFATMANNSLKTKPRNERIIIFISVIHLIYYLFFSLNLECFEEGDKRLIYRGSATTTNWSRTRNIYICKLNYVICSTYFDQYHISNISIYEFCTNSEVNENKTNKQNKTEVKCGPKK